MSSQCGNIPAHYWKWIYVCNFSWIEPTSLICEPMLSRLLSWNNSWWMTGCFSKHGWMQRWIQMILEYFEADLNASTFSFCHRKLWGSGTRTVQGLKEKEELTAQDEGTLIDTARWSHSRRKSFCYFTLNIFLAPESRAGRRKGFPGRHR